MKSRVRRWFLVISVTISERYMLWPVRLSSVCRLSSVTFVRPTQVVQIFGNISRHKVPWPSVDIR